MTIIAAELKYMPLVLIQSSLLVPNFKVYKKNYTYTCKMLHTPPKIYVLKIIRRTLENFLCNTIYKPPF